MLIKSVEFSFRFANRSQNCCVPDVCHVTGQNRVTGKKYFYRNVKLFLQFTKKCNIINKKQYLDKGKPFERVGRKASGLRFHTMTAELPKIQDILGVLSVGALAYEQESFIDVKELSNENLVELYVTAVLEKYENNLKFFEEELLKRRLFLVALDWFDYKKSLLKHTLSIIK